MPPQIATFVVAAGIIGLFWLDRDRTARTSKALWLPVIWIWIVGSRPVSAWLGITSTVSASQILEGSPLDRAIYQVLLAIGIIVLIGRKSRTSALLRANWPIILYFSYCLLSVLWSDFPDVAFKRWIKAIGDLVMVLIVMTDPKPAAALKRLFSRTAFILLPASVLLIKYFGDLGRSFDPWGQMMITGATTNKNLLGVITFVLSFGAVWRVLTLLRSKDLPNRRLHLLAQGTLLVFGIYLLVMAHSTTSAVCFAIGTTLMLATGLPVIARRPTAVHALVLMYMLAGGLVVLFGGTAGVVHAMGKQTDLTGRTAIWEAVIPIAPNALLGAGFESFWLGPRLEKIWSVFPVFQPNEAHNGYIEVYLNLGWVGLCIIALILVNGYLRAVAAFRRDPGIGGLMLAYIVTAMIYSVTEAGFRMLDPIWILLLLAVVGAGSVTSIAGRRAPRPMGAASVQTPMAVSSDTPVLISLGRHI